MLKISSLNNKKKLLKLEMRLSNSSKFLERDSELEYIILYKPHIIFLQLKTP